MRSPFITSFLTIDEAYREDQRRRRELDERLQQHRPARKQPPEPPQPQTPERPQRKRGTSGGRNPTFNPKQQAALQRQDRIYRKKNPGKFEHEVLEYLQSWAKTKYGIKTSPRTINKFVSC